MSIRNFTSLFEPGSVAVFGASLRPGSVGATVWRNLTSGSFKGELYAVNPKYQELAGHPVVAKASKLPAVPMLAVICTPPATIPALIKELGRLGTRAAVVMTAGMTDEEKQAMLAAAKP
ncbi:MAG: CoA-binding protein, partial [Rhodoferax sp.]|nr:CoA-binding protein [Rhodoferax sp.]